MTTERERERAKEQAALGRMTVDALREILGMDPLYGPMTTGAPAMALAQLTAWPDGGRCGAKQRAA